MDVYCFATFGSRSHTMRFSELLSRSGIPCRVTNTPSGAGDICSICVMFCACETEKVMSIINANPYLNFKGLYRFFTDGWKNEIKRIV